MTEQPTTAPQTTGTDNELTGHYLCPACFPAPQFGDSITALCGDTRHFLGLTDAGKDCRYCLALAPVVEATGRCPRCA